MAKRGGLAGIPIGPVIIIIIGIIVVLYILKNKNLFKFGAPVTVGAAVGDTVTGPNVYQVVSDLSGQGEVTIRGGGNSYRDNQSFDCSKCAREATWIFNPGGGEDASIKMGSHGDEGQGTSLIQYSTDGQKWRCEGPHMTYSDLSGEGSVPLGSSVVGVKGVSWNVSGGTNHHEIWLNESGDGQSWTLVAMYEGGADGCTEMACPVPDDGAGCQDTLRLDSPSGHEFISRTLHEITPGQLSNGAAPPAGTTPPPAATTPPPAEEEEEEEDEEDEDDEEEDEDEDYGENAEEYDEDSPEGRATSERVNNMPRPAAAARGNRRRRRSNLARRGPVTRAMLSAYSPIYFKMHRKLRIGNIG